MTDNEALRASGLTEEQVNRFQADGFLMVENFFSDEELDHYGKHVDSAVRHRTADDHRSLKERNLYEQTFVQCMRLWEDHPKVSPFTFNPKLCASAAALLDTDCVRLWHDQALYKEPGGRQTDAHMDYPFWPVDKNDLVSVWIPFQDVEPGGGMMSYVKGSHKAGISEFVDIGQLRGGAARDILKNEQVAHLPLVTVPVKKGSVIFHHASTIHAADSNVTDRVRRVFTVAYVADGCRRSRDDKYFALDRDRIKTGDLIVGPGHPVAWPRDEGDLPTPPVVPGPATGFGFSQDEAR